MLDLYGPARKAPKGDVLSALVETILSQNTTDINSLAAFQSLRKRYPTWEGARRAGPAGIEEQIRRGGLARTKSMRIHELLEDLKHRYGRCDLERLRELDTEQVIQELLSIKGVGPKTALVVALFEMGRPVFPMDTHVHRVLSRLGITDGDRSRLETHREIEALVAGGRLFDLHLHLIRFGRSICKPRPLCGECPLSAFCDYFEDRRAG